MRDIAKEIDGRRVIIKKPELLAPAGDLDKLKIAIMYGADAVFIGGKEFSLRARASNFTINDIKEACDFAEDYSAKIYVTMNILPHNEDLDGLIDYIKELENAGVTGIIVASPFIVKTILENSKLEAHISTQQSITNTASIDFFSQLGSNRVVLARELTKEEIKDICESTETEIEVFIHGGMCSSYSGRCTLSNNFTGRDANRGGCAHSCRWNYDMYGDEGKLTKDIPFSMSSKDLQTVIHIPDLIEMGVDSLKIEGRMKSVHYIATVVSSYRQLIDEYCQDPDSFSKDKLKYYLKEISKAENRLASAGFFEGIPTVEEQLYNKRSEEPNKLFVGRVLDYDSLSKIAIIEQRNKFLPNDELEVFSPSRKTKKFICHEIKDMDGHVLDAARHPKQLLQIEIPFEVYKYDMLRIVR